MPSGNGVAAQTAPTTKSSGQGNPAQHAAGTTHSHSLFIAGVVILIVLTIIGAVVSCILYFKKRQEHETSTARKVSGVINRTDFARPIGQPQLDPNSTPQNWIGGADNAAMNRLEQAVDGITSDLTKRINESHNGLQSEISRYQQSLQREIENLKRQVIDNKQSHDSAISAVSNRVDSQTGDVLKQLRDYQTNAKQMSLTEAIDALATTDPHFTEAARGIQSVREKLSKNPPELNSAAFQQALINYVLSPLELPSSAERLTMEQIERRAKFVSAISASRDLALQDACRLGFKLLAPTPGKDPMDISQYQIGGDATGTSDSSLDKVVAEVLEKGLTLNGKPVRRAVVRIYSYRPVSAPQPDATSSVLEPRPILSNIPVAQAEIDEIVTYDELAIPLDVTSKPPAPIPDETPSVDEQTVAALNAHRIEPALPELVTIVKAPEPAPKVAAVISEVVPHNEIRELFLQLDSLVGKTGEEVEVPRTKLRTIVMAVFSRYEANREECERALRDENPGLSFTLKIPSPGDKLNATMVTEDGKSGEGVVAALVAVGVTISEEAGDRRYTVPPLVRKA